MTIEDTKPIFVALHLKQVQFDFNATLSETQSRISAPPSIASSFIDMLGFSKVDTLDDLPIDPVDPSYI